MNIKKTIKRLVVFGFVAGISLILLIVVGNLWIVFKNKSSVYDKIESIPENNVGLVLGTSKNLVNGNTNLFFKYRVNAAADLFNAGKVKHLIVSGDNSNLNYNEPRTMYQALVKLGIPEDCITLDYAGFRTLDSVIRCKEVFQQNKFTIVSQEFHNYRAVYIGKYYGLDVVAFNAKEVTIQSNRTFHREYLARLKAMLDLHFLKTKPKFLGEKIDINL